MLLTAKMADSSSTRRAARAAWPIRKTSLAAQAGDEEDYAAASPEERLSVMWQLAVAAWSLTGRPMPSYTRAELPGRVIRPGGKA